MSINCKGIEMPGPYLPCANPINFSICVHLLSGCIFILSALVSRSFIGQALYGSWRQTPWWGCFQTFHQSGRFIEEIQEAYWSCYNACHKQKIQMATWKVISPGKSCRGFHQGLSGSVCHGFKKGKTVLISLSRMLNTCVQEGSFRLLVDFWLEGGSLLV